MGDSRPLPSFMSVLQFMAAGTRDEDGNYDMLLDELAERLQEVVAAVIETDKKGALTLKLEVAKFDRGSGGGAVTIVPSITTKVPEPTKPSALFYASTGGNLHREDPNQISLTFGPRSTGTTIDHDTIDEESQHG